VTVLACGRRFAAQRKGAAAGVLVGGRADLERLFSVPFLFLLTFLISSSRVAFAARQSTPLGGSPGTRATADGDAGGPQSDLALRERISQCAVEHFQQESNSSQFDPAGVAEGISGIFSAPPWTEWLSGS
jgi:hypothetical protein